MSISEFVDRDAPYCASGESLQQAAERMCLWEQDALPVCRADRRLIGCLTARAICQQACLSGRPLAELLVADAQLDETLFVRAGDSSHDVIETMSARRSWLLPVVDDDHRLLGSVTYRRMLQRRGGGPARLAIVVESNQLPAGQSPAGAFGMGCGPSWTLVTRHRELRDPRQRGCQLSRAEVSLLLTLAQRGGAVVGREELTHSVAGRPWDPSDRYVDVVVASLRKRFGERGCDAKVIRTVPCEGYLLTLEVLDLRDTRLSGGTERHSSSRRPSLAPAAAAG